MLLRAILSGHDASQITLALGTAAAYPRACQALGAMLSKGALNPADITVLFKMFSSMDPPPVELVSLFESHFIHSRTLSSLYAVCVLMLNIHMK